MRILIISQEVWRNDQNGGNVLTNLFRSFEELAGQNESMEFAQIYCAEGIPQNQICRHYYQITDHMVVNNVLHRDQTTGREFYTTGDSESKCADQPDGFQTLKKHRLESFLVAKEMAWKLSGWNNDSFRSFITSFNPDVIFAPSYGWLYMQKLTRVVKALTDKPVISYISDDFFSNRQFRFSPIFWMRHFLLRHSIRKTFRCYDLVYTMTEEQKKQCEKAFGANMKVLLKSADFSATPLKQTVNDPIRLVYGGNLYQNRDRTLCRLADAIREINRDGVRMTLDVYSNSALSKQSEQSLNDTVSTRLHKAVPQAELAEIYRQSDIALHAEGFDLKSRLVVRLSFSTKIIDCLASGCATMAICHPSQSGYRYLKRNDLAICCDSLNQLSAVLRGIQTDPKALFEVQHRAVAFGKANHDESRIARGIYQDFSRICQP